MVLVASPDGVLRGDVRRLLAGLDVAPVTCVVGAGGEDGQDPVGAARTLHASTGQPCITERVRYSRGEARAEVALADAGGARMFTGALRGSGDDEASFVPDGVGRSLGALGDAAYLAGPRRAPYLEVADALRGRSYRGAFEAHVTVAPPSAGLDAFRATCERLGAACIAIELAAGETRAQPMTGSHHRGDLLTVMHEVHALARALLASFDVVRTKIEAQPGNADLPETDAEAARVPQLYFEYHLQLVVAAGADLPARLDAIAARCAPHGAHLSRNARSRRTDGSEERFVTLRVRAGRATADARAAALVEALADQTIAKRICEYTVYDSDLAIDRGWLP